MYSSVQMHDGESEDLLKLWARGPRLAGVIGGNQLLHALVVVALALLRSHFLPSHDFDCS